MQQQNTMGTFSGANGGATGGSKQKVVMAALAILAVVGMGFGVIGMMQANEKSGEVSSLKEENAKKNAMISKIEESLGAEIVEVENNSTEVVETPIKSSNKYIYVGEWGIKLRIPDEIGTIQYTFDGYPTAGYAADDQTLCVSGQKKGAQAVMRFADLLGDDASVRALGCLTRTTDKTGPTPSAQRVYEDANYSYIYSAPHAIMGDEWAAEEEVATVKLFGKMFTEGISEF